MLLIMMFTEVVLEFLKNRNKISHPLCSLSKFIPYPYHIVKKMQVQDLSDGAGSPAHRTVIIINAVVTSKQQIRTQCHGSVNGNR